MTLEEQIKQYINQGMTVLEIQSKLRTNGTPVPWVKIQQTYNEVKEK